MAFGRSRKCIVVPHEIYFKRIQKSLYYWKGISYEEGFMHLSYPLASYASELFSKSQQGYSLNRLSPQVASRLHASPCSLIMALIFLERLNAVDPSYVRRISPQDLFIVSLMISTKFYVGYDEDIYLSDWAAEGNLTEDNLKKLELEYLYAIDWNIFISNEEFFNKLSVVEKSLAQREGLQRGWFTYTELIQMLPAITFTNLWINAVQLYKHFAVMLTSYTAGVLTIAGAFLLASQIPGHVLHRQNESGSSTNNLKNLALSLKTCNETEVDFNSTTDRTSISIVLDQHSATCSALNAEDEILRLEHQYEKDKLNESIRNQNNVINGSVQATLFTDITRLIDLKPLKLKKWEYKWNFFRRTSQQEKLVKHFTSNFSKMSGANYSSFDRLPTIWFKFI